MVVELLVISGNVVWEIAGIWHSDGDDGYDTYDTIEERFNDTTILGLKPGLKTQYIKILRHLRAEWATSRFDLI